MDSACATEVQDSLLGSERQLSGSANYQTSIPIEHGGRNNNSNSFRLDSPDVLKKAAGSDTLSFHDINYTVNVRKNPFSRKSTQKHILKNVNGLCKPGMNAILGPTGSGKSSLLDVLAGRKDPKGLTGTLLLGGSPVPENFKCLVGYVVQDDVVMGTLTVRENFEFSARLRLPKSVTPEMRKERVDQVIYELGLTEVADSKVGTEFIRGVSGGERKRCNIGMELIISPPVLFLDEPTTGLDASTANAVMLLLKRMSERGRNIIFSIHQPRYSIFRLFDSLMLLSHGDVVYHGVASNALDYFTSLGYVCELHNNPPDFFLDVINGDSTAVAAMGNNATVGNGTATGQDVPAVEFKKTKKRRESLKDESIERDRFLADSYKASATFKEVTDELEVIHSDYLQDRENGVIKQRRIDFKTGFGTQLAVVSGRCVKNIIRNPATSFMQFFVIIIFAALVGAIYYQLNSSITSGIQNRVGAFFFIIMNQVFGNMSAVELFIKERSLFIHENVSGFYRVSSYFVAKVFCDLVPMRMIPCLLFSSVSYFMIGLRETANNFFVFTLTLFVTSMSASALSFVISSSVKIFALANLCLALSYVFMMLFSGLLINVADLGAWISWVKYLSIFRYGLCALNINELKDHNFCDANGTVCISGNTYLDDQGIDYGTDWDVWSNITALGILTVAFLILAYIQLLRIKKLK